MKIFANPNLPQIDDYYEPFTFDYDHLQSAKESKAAPTARPRSLITGQRMEKIQWGPNWEEILGGEFSKRSADANLANFEQVQKDMVGQFENTFMMYLPRLAHVRQRLPLQEDLLQLADRQGREVHLLLPAHRSRPAHRVQ
jgi:nitrate reductase beta subunit